MTTTSPLFILYGSATGNAEHIAKDLASTYEGLLKNPDAKTFFSSVVCCELDQFKKKGVPIWDVAPTNEQIKHGVLIVTSTTGNGDSPENASRFVRQIKRKTTPNTMFQHVAYAVLALGDTNYDQFCHCGKTIDKRVDELGGTRARSIACADEGTGLEDVVDPWVATILTDITNACRNQQSAVPATETEPATAAATTTTSKENGSSKAVPLVAPINTTKTKVTEEKKVDTDETTQHARITAAAAGGSGSVVETLKSLLQLSPTDDLPSVDAKFLPASSAATLSSCAMCDSYEAWEKEQQEQLQNRPRGLSSADTHSTTSSGYHYTFHKPYESTVFQARYLTQTSTDVAQQICDSVSVDDLVLTAMSCSSDSSTITDQHLQTVKQATAILEHGFPLNNNNSGEDDPSVYERNGKRIVELTLSLPDDYTLEYSPGDSLGLIVDNPPHAVQFVLQMLKEHHKIAPSQLISIDSNPPISVQEAIRKTIDLGTTTPLKNKRILLSLAQYATNAKEASLLKLLASKTEQGCSLFETYIEQQSRTVVDVLKDFPSCQSIPLEVLMGLLPSIPPRYYSVSSSPLCQDRQRLSLTVAFSVVDYLTPSLIVNGMEQGNRRIHGVATGYLEAVCAPLLLANGTTVPSRQPKVSIFPKPTAEFRMPASLSTPLILIGPGTGVAPFMGFLSHRRALLNAASSAVDANAESTEAASSVVEGTWRGGYDVEENELPVCESDASGLNLGVDFRNKQQQQRGEAPGYVAVNATPAVAGSVDLFFGCRHRDHDWLYRSEMERFQEEKVITHLYTAFSRDNNSSSSNSPRTKYVQDIMKSSTETADRIRDLILIQNASVYICGDGNHMAKDVQAAIAELLSRTLDNDADNDKLAWAKEYIEEMKKTNRYLLDIWS